MSVIDAYHLPGLRDDDVVDWDVREYEDGAVALRVPVLGSAGLRRIAARIREARDRYLRRCAVADVVRAVDAAAARLARPNDPLRRQVEDALPGVTGYSAPMVRLVLDRMVPDWRAPALDRLLRAEFGDPRVLDGFRPRDPDAASASRAFGPALAFHVFAGNVPGVAVTSLVRSLLVKAATLGKTASGEPVLAPAFARALAEVAPELGECLAVTYWPGGEERLEAVALQAADTVVVYGGEGVAEDLRGRLPADTRLVVHGPRLSFGLIGRGALAADHLGPTAAAAARAVATFDQQGCVSPHVLYVEEGGDVSPRAFAQHLAAALARVEEELPRGTLDAAEAASIRQLRGAAEFRGLGGGDVDVFGSKGTEYTVIYEADPAFTASCLNRLVWIKPLERLEAVEAYVAPYAAYLQTVAVVGAGERRAALAAQLGALGASRITTLERMPWPPPTWHHDGRGPLRELVRWVDLEG